VVSKVRYVSPQPIVLSDHPCRCDAPPSSLKFAGDNGSLWQDQALLDLFKYNPRHLWYTYGINSAIQVRETCIYHTTANFSQPYTTLIGHGDIHKLITPDLLHQLIIGTFKDHLIEWIQEYLHQDGESEGDQVLDIINHRCAFSQK
jgi:hypothetical protein